MGGTLAVADDELRVPLTDFQRKVSALVARAKEQPLTLTRNGQPVAVLLDIDVFHRMIEVEEQAEDIYWTVVALRQDIEWHRAGRPTVPLEELEARERGRD